VHINSPILCFAASCAANSVAAVPRYELCVSVVNSL